MASKQSAVKDERIYKYTKELLCIEDIVQHWTKA